MARTKDAISASVNSGDSTATGESQQPGGKPAAAAPHAELVQRLRSRAANKRAKGIYRINTISLEEEAADALEGKKP